MTPLESALQGLNEILKGVDPNSELAGKLLTVCADLEAHKQDMANTAIPTCPHGYVWSPSANACILDVG
jgi:hypothetical protein